MREFDANSNELKELSKVRLSDIPEAVDLLRVEANQLGMTGQAGSMARFAITTADGIAHTPRGIYNAALHNIQHPSEMFKTIVGSAAIAAALKIALPEAGPVGKIAAGVMGTWFIASSAPAFLEDY